MGWTREERVLVDHESEIMQARSRASEQTRLAEVVKINAKYDKKLDAVLNDDSTIGRRKFLTNNIGIQRNNAKSQAMREHIYRSRAIWDEYVKAFYSIFDGTYVLSEEAAAKIKNAIHQIRVTEWTDSTSPHWKHATKGEWPDWVERITAKIPGPGHSGQLRIYGNANPAPSIVVIFNGDHRYHLYANSDPNDGTNIVWNQMLLTDATIDKVFPELRPIEEEDEEVHVELTPEREEELANLVYDIQIDKWLKTASGNWRRALEGDWPQWIDRIVVRLRGGPIQLRIFGHPEVSPINVRFNGQHEFTLNEIKFPRGWGNAINFEESDLVDVFPGIYRDNAVDRAL